MNPAIAHATSVPGHSVPAADARSWLLVPGTKPERFAPATESRADAVLIDIEDAVDTSRKPQARQDAVDFLETGSAWVRVNDCTTEFWADDLEALADARGLRGVMLAKAETPEQVVNTFHRLGGRVPVVPLVESARGLEAAGAIAKAEGAFRLAFGSGDFRRDTGMWASREAMAYARSRLTVASRAAGLPGAIDGPTTDESLRTLREQSEWTLEHGMTGKLALRVEQCAVINEVICPQASDVLWAQSFLEEFEAAGGQIRDGSDPPRLGRARKILRLADAFGLLVEA
ncbi:CoA ester lyase [Pseudoclavibacter endophyticus]|uniref:CoA ester lyase n=1 Tax=Pseudoclavibacter endophyticus TaxID=1778590 RepID=A0A6H9WJ02_9MICO|nr:CoA ester lyase [Pseudoclavibacter endophyticus]KAB1648786.1 CoA ester lyase [Pseudoclavibacter endophyticus]GGA68513.1 CoA ester lyase [Pseudoclavibacter endophyticus]